MIMRPDKDDVLTLDFETVMDARSGYSLQRMPSREFVTDPRFAIIAAGIAIGASDVMVFTRGGPAGGDLEDARVLLEREAAAGRWLAVQNVSFEGMVLKLGWGIQFANVFDVAGYLRFLNLGYSLENIGHGIGMPKAAAPAFDLRVLSDPAGLAQLVRYNANDVMVTRRVLHLALDDQSYPDREFAFAARVTEENVTGIAIDQAHASKLSERYRGKRDDALRRLSLGFPEFDTTAIASVPKVLAFCAALGGRFASLSKKSPEIVAAKANDAGRLGAFLRLRDEVMTWSRYADFAGRVAAGTSRIHFPLKYWGAHTGRMSSSGKDADRVNVQNLPRGDTPGFEPLKELRGILVANCDESWIGCDLSTIEARVTAFLAGQQDLLERFAANVDVYIWFGARVFPGVRIVKNGENDHLRRLCKEAVLGLGFGMGSEKLFERIRLVLPGLTRDVAVALHQGYRDAFPQIVALRAAYHEAFAQAADGGRTATVHRCTFERIDDGTGATVRVWLPTGRPLHYRSVIGRPRQTPWGTWPRSYCYAPSYEFQADKPRRPPRTVNAGKAERHPDGRWRYELSPSTLVENIVQACARDLIVAQLLAIEKSTDLRMRFSVHDELIIAAPRCDCAEPPGSGATVVSHRPDCGWLAGREVVRSEMSRVPDDLPGLAGLPVGCELSDAIVDRYGK